MGILFNKADNKKIICKNPFCDNIFTMKSHNHSFCCNNCSILFHKEKYKKASLGILKNSKNQFYNFLKLRFKVFKRDNFTCQYCGKNVKDNVKLEIDHVIPKSKGGEDIFDNFITSYNYCNEGKGDFLLKQQKKFKNKVVKSLKKR